MREPKTPEIGTCALCGSPFEISTNRKLYCSKICKHNGEYRDPLEHAAMLEASTAAFVAAIMIDIGYVIELAEEGSRRAAREAARRAA